MKMVFKRTGIQPRLVVILSILLILQAPLLIIFGLNLLNNDWLFLTSWQNLWQSFSSAFQIARETPDEFVKGEALFYNFIAFLILVFNAGISFAAGLIFPSKKPGAWVMALLAQIGTLITGIGMYFIHHPPQANRLMVVGVIMVMYLNSQDIRHWFMQVDKNGLGAPYVEN